MLGASFWNTTHLCVLQQQMTQDGRHSAVGGRRTSSTFLHSHLAMIPAGSKAGSVLLPRDSSMASTPALQVTSRRSLTLLPASSTKRKGRRIMLVHRTTGCLPADSPTHFDAMKAVPEE